MQLDCEIGFELIGKFTMPATSPPGFAGGERLLVSFRDQPHPIEVIVIKCTDVAGVRTVTFGTPHVVKIETTPG